MGRPEGPVPEPALPLPAFATGLRALRDDAGRPTYESMARATGVSKTALSQAAGGRRVPRWRTVEAYVRHCGGDVDDWRRRWEELQSDGPVATAQTAPAEDRPTRRRGRLVGAGVGVLVLAGGITTWAVLSRGIEAAGPFSPASGVTCNGGPAEPAVVIVNLAAADGGLGIAQHNVLTVEVERDVGTGRTYWVMVHLYRTDGDPYFAKGKLSPAPGRQQVPLQFDDAVGSRRDVYVVEADPAATADLERNLAGQFTFSDNPDRLYGPAAPTISPVCLVEKQRAD